MKPWVYRTASFPNIFTERALLYLVGTKKRDFLNMTANKSRFYKIDSQPKKNGGFREIHKPAWPLKLLLKNINRRFLSKLSLPDFVHCGPQGRSIITAARGHNRFTHHLSLDVTSFFDNISKTKVSSVLRGIGINKEITNTLIKISVENNRLPQGFPTSPLLSALVISHTLQYFHPSFNREDVLLSIYADDILISSDSEEKLLKAKHYIQERLKEIGLQLNTKEHLARNGQQFRWLSLQIYPWTTLPRKDLLKLEKNVYEYKTRGVVPSDFIPKKQPQNPAELRSMWEESMTGKVVFARSVTRNRLSEKSLTNLESLIRKS